MTTEIIATETQAQVGEAPQTREQTIESIKAQLRGEEPQGQPESEATSETVAEPAKVETKAQEEYSQRAKERQARIESLRAQETKFAESRKDRDRVSALEAQLRQAQTEAGSQREQLALLQQIKHNPAALFELASHYGVEPQQIAESLREQLESPDRYGAKLAKKEFQPELQALQQQIEDLRQERENERAQVQQERAETQARQEFFSLCESDKAPERVANLSKSPENRAYLYNLATKIAPSMPRGADFEDLVFEVENTLEQLEQLTTGFRPPPTKAQSPNLGSKTVNGGLQAQRDNGQDPWDSLNMDQRKDALIAQLRSGY